MDIENEFMSNPTNRRFIKEQFIIVNKKILITVIKYSACKQMKHIVDITHNQMKN
jgi:hypothetical protein